jgi:hypothetical protein
MAPAGHKRSRHARGYTSAHVARRRQLEPLVATGQVSCSRCGELIQPDEAWHLDHRDDRRGYLGAAHAECNLRAAGRKRHGLREPEVRLWSRVSYTPIPRTSSFSPTQAGTSRAFFLEPVGSVPLQSLFSPRWVQCRLNQSNAGFPSRLRPVGVTSPAVPRPGLRSGSRRPFGRRRLRARGARPPPPAARPEPGLPLSVGGHRPRPTARVFV